MTVRITRAGKVPGDEYYGHCEHCNGRLEVDEGEKADFKEKDKNLFYECPTKGCGKMVQLHKKMKG